MKKQFDWEFAKKQHSPETYDYILKNHNKVLSEEQFVKGYTSLPRNKKYASVTRGPHACRHAYRTLQNKFGFFK